MHVETAPNINSPTTRIVVVNGTDHVVVPVHDIPGFRDEIPPVLIQNRRASGSVENRYTQLVLQCLHLLADRSMGHERGGRRCGKGALFCDRNQSLEPADGHDNSFVASFS